jgi:hypothetical protein
MAVSLTDLCDRRNCFFSRDRFLIKYRRIFSRRVLSPSIRKDVKVTIAVRSWVTELVAAKALDKSRLEFGHVIVKRFIHWRRLDYAFREQAED